MLHKVYRANSFVMLNKWFMYYVTTLIRSNTIIRSIAYFYGHFYSFLTKQMKKKR